MNRILADDEYREHVLQWLVKSRYLDVIPHSLPQVRLASASESRPLQI